MNVVGIHDITVSATTIIIRESKGLEVALVLDNTGSMGTTKMNNLKSAAHSFLDILFGSNADSDLLYISVVPFAGTVNVDPGFGHLTSDYDADDYDPDFWRGCVMARDSGEDQTDTAPTSEALRWESYLRPSGSGTGGRRSPAALARSKGPQGLPAVSVGADQCEGNGRSQDRRNAVARHHPHQLRSCLGLAHAV